MTRLRPLAPFLARALRHAATLALAAADRLQPPAWPDTTVAADSELRALADELLADRALMAQLGIRWTP